MKRLIVWISVIMAAGIAVWPGCQALYAETPPAQSPYTEKPQIPMLDRVKIIEEKSVGYTAGLEIPDLFYPSGWMGDHGDITMEYAYPSGSHEHRYSQKWGYSAAGSQDEGWAGVAWQYPENNFGSFKGRNLTGIRKVSFWARGENGGEIILVKIGGLNDSLYVASDPMTLGTDWKRYVIDISGKDLSNVTSGFCWYAFKKDNPEGCVFYLDHIRYE